MPVKDPHARVRKRLAKLKKRHRYLDAVEVQKEICRSNDQNDSDWQELAELARHAGLADLELASRFRVAELTLVGPDEWLRLADQASKSAFAEDAVEARFRAADAAARMGDCRWAIKLCDVVLSDSPQHEPTRRIRGLMIRRLENLEADVDSEWGGDSTLTFLRNGLVAKDRAEVNYAQEQAFDEITQTEWPPEPVELEPAQRFKDWPTILERQCLLFLGSSSRMGSAVTGLMDTVVFGPGAAVFEQGSQSDLLYSICSGAVCISRGRSRSRDLGTLHPGTFFGDVGAISGLPATTHVHAAEESEIGVLSRSALNRVVEQDPPVAAELVARLRHCYLGAIAAISPILAACITPKWRSLSTDSDWVTFSAGTTVAETGEPGALYAIITGSAEVILPPGTRLGVLSPADLIGEIDPSPVTVKTLTALFAVRVERHLLEHLPEDARSEVSRRAEQGRRALESYSPPCNGTATRGQ